MAEGLAREFSSTKLRVQLEKHDNPLQFSVVLENTGEVLHSNGIKRLSPTKTKPHKGTTIRHPTEVERLLMVSRIGQWFVEQRKLAEA